MQTVLLVSHWYSFRALPPWDWERKTIHIVVMDRLVSDQKGPYKPLGGDTKGSVGLKRPLKGLYETFQKALRDSFSGWQDKNDPRQESPE